MKLLINTSKYSSELALQHLLLINIVRMIRHFALKLATKGIIIIQTNGIHLNIASIEENNLKFKCFCPSYIICTQL